MRRIAYHSGTWIPLVILGSILLTYFYARTEGLTWERPAIYLFGIVSLIFGCRVLFVDLYVAEVSGEKARFYPLALLWTGFSIMILFFGLLIASVESIFLVQLVPEAAKFAFIVGGVVSIAILSAISFAGQHTEILDKPADPVPGRSIWRAWRK